MTSETRKIDDLGGAIVDSGARLAPSAHPAAGPRRPLHECGDLDIRIARSGTWFYHGSPIGRKPLVTLFARYLRREADGHFYIVTPAERGRVVVDDAPFVAVEVNREGRGRTQKLRFRTNVDDEVIAGPGRPIRVVTAVDTGEPSPYVLVDRGLEALILRPVFYELVEWAETAADGSGLGVWSDGAFFVLGQT
jgi:hypothetical protein